jgi:hypothetical protein
MVLSQSMPFLWYIELLYFRVRGGDLTDHHPVSASLGLLLAYLLVCIGYLQVCELFLYADILL